MKTFSFAAFSANAGGDSASSALTSYPGVPGLIHLRTSVTPQTGASAANSSGCARPICHVPPPPIERPVSEMRSGSTL